MDVDYILVVDFEKCFYGPCGLDLGLFLSNYLYYYAAHPYPMNRRSLSGGVAAVLESYRSAFIIQALGAAKEKQIEIDPEALWNEVISSIQNVLRIIRVGLT